MSRGMTIADFVQQVFYAKYKVRLDVAFDPALPEAFHADTDKFKEILFEGNFVLQELQKEQDWNWLRDRVIFGISGETCSRLTIPEFTLPEDAYKVCTGFYDAVRLHDRTNPSSFIEVPFTSPRGGTTNLTAMFDETGCLNVPDTRLLAFVIGNTLTFSRPFSVAELNRSIETDFIRLLPQLHICGPNCVQPCEQAYVDKVFTEISDPYYMVVRTAAKSAEGDPSISDRALSLSEEAMKLLSAMRENDSSKTVPDTYSTVELGHTRIL